MVDEVFVPTCTKNFQSQYLNDKFHDILEYILMWSSSYITMHPVQLQIIWIEGFNRNGSLYKDLECRDYILDEDDFDEGNKYENENPDEVFHECQTWLDSLTWESVIYPYKKLCFYPHTEEWKWEIDTPEGITIKHLTEGIFRQNEYKYTDIRSITLDKLTVINDTLCINDLYIDYIIDPC